MLIQQMTFAEFETLCAATRAAGCTLVPVYQRISFDLLTPVLAYLRLRRSEQSPSVLLEGVAPGQRSRYSYVAVNPSERLEVRAGSLRRVEIATGKTLDVIEGNPVARLNAEFSRRCALPAPRLPPFTGGWVGYVSYDFVRCLEEVPAHPGTPLPLPEVCLDRYDRVLAIDHFDNQAYAVVYVDVSRLNPTRGYQIGCAHLLEVLTDLQRPQSEDIHRTDTQHTVRPSMARDEYEAAVRRILEHIRAGDTFQTVLAQHFSVPLGVGSLDVYRALRMINPSPYLFHLDLGGGNQLIGASPEVLVEVADGVVRIRPIAGTRRRGNTPEEDDRLEGELLDDPKERAEHRMLIDLARNDVSKVARAGTIAVHHPEHVERYSHVMHIVSDVVGKLRPECSALDALFAGFPAGTLTGAPKIRAMQVIADLEPVPRGPYGGGVGYLGFDGNLDFCITIRSMVICQGVAHFHAGAGIVVDSDPAREYQETMAKAAALSAALALTNNSPKLGSGGSA